MKIEDANKNIGHTVYNTAIELHGTIVKVDVKWKSVYVSYNNSEPIWTSCTDLILSSNKRKNKE